MFGNKKKIVPKPVMISYPKASKNLPAPPAPAPEPIPDTVPIMHTGRAYNTDTVKHCNGCKKNYNNPNTNLSTEEARFKMLEKAFDLDDFDKFHDDYGYFIDENTGELFRYSDMSVYKKEDENCGGLICGVAINHPTPEKDENAAPVVIALTEDDGFRYVAPMNGGSVKDLGPVVDACLVGNAQGCEGIYIPFRNAKAVITGAMVVNHMADVICSTMNSEELARIMPADVDFYKF